MRFGKIGSFFALCLLTSLFAFGLIAYGSRITNGAPGNALYKNQVRNAIAEIAFPSGNDAVAIDTAAGNLSFFMSYRAGVLVSDFSEDKLRSAEQIVQGSEKRISKADLADILTNLAANRLRELTDAQKDRVVESLRGFDDPNLPESFKRGRDHVSVRSSGEGRMTVAEFSSTLDSVRGENADSKLVTTLIRNSIALEIGEVCEALEDASPGFFGDTKCDMTALQALLVSYAVVTDDDLAGNRAELESRLLEMQERISQKFHIEYPGPEGHKAYGPNGYIFSTPADLLLDDASLASIISKIEEKLN
jgi:hypothetical protein